MRSVKIRELLQEYDLEIDDVRWYLASTQADRILSYRESKRELIRLIWSGSLEGELYDMQSDPQELDNLWADPAHADVRWYLSQRLLDWTTSVDTTYNGARGGESVTFQAT